MRIDPPKDERECDEEQQGVYDYVDSRSADESQSKAVDVDDNQHDATDEKDCSPERIEIWKQVGVEGEVSGIWAESDKCGIASALRVDLWIIAEFLVHFYRSLTGTAQDWRDSRLRAPPALRLMLIFLPVGEVENDTSFAR